MELPVALQQHIETITRDIGGLDGLSTLLPEEDIIYLATYPSSIFVITSYEYYNWLNRNSLHLDTIEPPIDLDKAGYIYDSIYTVFDRNHKVIYSDSLSEGQFYGDNENDSIIFQRAAATISGCDYFFIRFYTHQDYKLFPILIITKPTNTFYSNFLTQIRKLYQQRDKEPLAIPHNLILYTTSLHKYRLLHNITSFKDKFSQHPAFQLHQNDYVQSTLDISGTMTKVQLPNGDRVWVNTSALEVLYIDVYILPLNWKHAPSIEDVKTHPSTQYIRANPLYNLSLNLTNQDTWLVIEQDYHLIYIKDIIGSAFYSITEITKGLYFIKPRSGKNISKYNLLQRNLNKAEIEPYAIKRISTSGELEYYSNVTGYGAQIVGKTFIDATGLSFQPIPTDPSIIQSGSSSLSSRVFNIQRIPVEEIEVIGSFSIGHERNWPLTESTNLSVTILVWQDNSIIATYAQDYSNWYGISANVSLLEDGYSYSIVSSGLTLSIGIPSSKVLYTVNKENEKPDKIEAFIYDGEKLYVIRYFDNYALPSIYNTVPAESVDITIDIYTGDRLLSTYSKLYKTWSKLYFLKNTEGQIELRSIGTSLIDEEVDNIVYLFKGGEVPSTIEVSSKDNSTGYTKLDYYSTTNIEYRQYLTNIIDVGIIIYKNYDYCDIYHEQYTEFNGIYYKQTSPTSWELRVVGKSFFSAPNDPNYTYSSSSSVDNLIHMYYGTKEQLPHKIEILLKAGNTQLRYEFKRDDMTFIYMDSNQ